MQRLYMIFFIIFLLIISFFCGKYIYKISRIDEGLISKSEYINENNSKDLKTTSSNEIIKVSPNAVIIFKIKYNKCGHTLNEYRNVNVNEVNLSKEEIEKLYMSWNVLNFSEKEIILSKEIEESCNQHYIISEKDGYLAIYIINDMGNVMLKEVTSISTKYLTEADFIKLKIGIRVNGLEELNSKLEDFE